MKIISLSVRTIAAAAISLAVCGTAFAQPTLTPAAPGEAATGAVAYKNAMKVVKSDYQAAREKCNAMSGADQRNCVADAKAARKVDISNAKQMRTSAVTSASRDGTSGSPGK